MGRDVAIIAYAHSALDAVSTQDEVELTQEVCRAVRQQAGLEQRAIGFTVSGSCDFISGRPFSFVSALDGVGAFPPIRESHVEMDGAFALYEAWVRLQHGDIDTALVYAFGQPSFADINRVFGLQLDPHWAVPLGLDERAVAGLQAGAARADGRMDSADLKRLPLRDGAAAVILAAGDAVHQSCPRPAWIRAIDHRMGVSVLGERQFAQVPSARQAAEAIDLASYALDGAELHVQFEHQKDLLARSLNLGDRVPVNHAATSQVDVSMVSGLMRLGEAARAIMTGEAQCMLGHASAGPALQQNLLCVLEAQA
jgi:hypothetical protein